MYFGDPGNCSLGRCARSDKHLMRKLVNITARFRAEERSAFTYFLVLSALLLALGGETSNGPPGDTAPYSELKTA